MSIDVRPVVPADAAKLAAVNIRSIREVCGPDYPDAAVLDAWCANKTAENYGTWIASPSTRCFTGLVDGEIAGVGMMDLDQGCVHMPYLAPEGLGRGLGKALLTVMEQTAIAHGHQTLKLDSTVTARAFYEAQGFTNLGPTDDKDRPGYRMETALAQQP